MLKWLLRYLKGSLYLGLHIQPSTQLNLIAFSNVDGGCCPYDKHSVLTHCVYFGHSLVSWASMEQHVSTRIDTESEYRALANATTERTYAL